MKGSSRTMCGAVALIALLTATMAAAVSPSIKAASVSAAAVDCRTSATIGYVGPTTGPAASIGEEIRQWSLFAIDRWNANPKHTLKFKVVEGDDRLDPAETSTIAQQFVSNSSILGVVGPASSQEVLAASPIFKRAGLAYSNNASRTDLTKGKPGFFRTGPRDSDQARTTVDYMARVLHAKKVAIFDDQGSYSVPLADAVEKLLKKKGVEVFRGSVSQKQVDFSSVVTTIPGDADVVYTPFTVPANMQLFADQMREQGKDITVYAGDSGYSADFHFNGAYFSTFAPDIRNIRAARPIVKQYFKKYGSKAGLTVYGPPMYVAAEAMTAAIARACRNGTASRAEVMKEMFRTRLPKSLLGIPIRFTKRGELRGAEFYMFQIRNGKAVYLP